MNEVDRLEAIKTLIEVHPEVADRLSPLCKQKLKDLPRLQMDAIIKDAGFPKEWLKP